jgi:hypothetical protein
MPTKRAADDEIQRVRAALVIVARLVENDLVYLPIFERLDADLKALEESDPVARARAIIAVQRAML